MEDYVDKIGGLKPKHFKHKDIEDIASTVMKELNTHTENLSKLEEERRLVKAKNNATVSNIRNTYGMSITNSISKCCVYRSHLDHNIQIFNFLSSYKKTSLIVCNTYMESISVNSKVRCNYE